MLHKYKLNIHIMYKKYLKHFEDIGIGFKRCEFNIGYIFRKYNLNIHVI